MDEKDKKIEGCELSKFCDKTPLKIKYKSKILDLKNLS